MNVRRTCLVALAGLVGSFAVLTAPALPAAATTYTPIPVPPSPAPHVGALLVHDREAGRLTPDQFALYGVQSIVAPALLPEPYRSAPPYPGDASGYGAGYLDAPMSEATEEAIRALLFPQVSMTAAGPVPMVPIGPDDGTGPYTDCALPERLLVMTFQCSYTGAHYVVYYSIDAPRAQDNVPPADADANRRPDYVDRLIDGMDEGYAHYVSTLGYRAPDEPIRVIVRGTDLNGSPAVALPTSLLIGFNLIIVRPVDEDGVPTMSNYLARHELFHAVQYRYIDKGDLYRELNAYNWWMEATAEWASHQSMAASTSGRLTAAEMAEYHDSLVAFLGRPHEAIGATDGLGGARQYGAVVVAQYLSDRLGVDAVRRTWEKTDEVGYIPLGAVAGVLYENGLNVRSELAAFARANYLLGASGATTWAYTDPDVPTGWRSRLQESNWTWSDANGAARPARSAYTVSADVPLNQSANLAPGGAMYVDLVRPGGALPGTMVVDATQAASAPADLTLLAYSAYPQLCQAPVQVLHPDNPTGTGSVVIGHGCTSATLVATNTEIYGTPEEPMFSLPQWTVTFFEEPPPLPLPPNGAVLTTGTVKLGVSQMGNLITAGLDGLPVGLRSANGADGLVGGGGAGWGISGGGSTGWAHSGGASNVRVVSFSSSFSSATAVVEVGDTFRITHNFKSVNNDFFEDKVTVRLIGAAATTGISGWKWRQTHDWMMPLGPEKVMFGNERTSFLPSIRFGDSANASADPTSDAGGYEPYANTGVAGDYGAVFDIEQGALCGGCSRVMWFYFGASTSVATRSIPYGASSKYNIAFSNTDGTPVNFTSTACLGQQVGIDC